MPEQQRFTIGEPVQQVQGDEYEVSMLRAGDGAGVGRGLVVSRLPLVRVVEQRTGLHT